MILFLVVALAIAAAAVLQGALLEDLLQPQRRLRVLLPEAGVAGLAPGAAVEVLGTPAGTVREIVIEPDQSLHARVDIDERMTPFIRRDSRVTIRRQFGIAGAAFLEISRGAGAPLDWDFAVLSAETERAPTDDVGELIDELRSRVFPVIEETERTMVALAALAESLNDPGHPLQRSLADVAALTGAVAGGEGAVGRLLTDDAAAREAEAILTAARARLEELAPLIASLAATGESASGLAGSLAAPDRGVPALLGDARGAIAEARQAVPGLVALSENARGASEDLPLMLTQVQVTLQELESLLVVLRGNWLIGGQGPASPAGEAAPLAVDQIRP